MATVLPITMIESDPAIRGGRPVLAGTAIRVSDVVGYYIFGGMTPEDVASQFNLSLGQVHAALAYYYTHQTNIDAEVQANTEDAERWRGELSQQGRLLNLE